MRIASLLISMGVVTLTACGGASTTASTEMSRTQPAGEAVSDPSSASVETLPALLDPSTDIEAIESPVVLWFWSPG